MRVYLLITLILAIKTQNLSEEIKEGTGFDAAKEVADLNDSASEAAYEDEKTRIMDEFMKQAIIDLGEFKKNTKEINVGKFVVNVQNSCILAVPEPPVIPPVELECITGNLEGEIMAKAIATLSKENLRPTEVVMEHLAECELIVEKEVTFNVYNNCLNLETRSYYEKLLATFAGKMSKLGYEYTLNDDGSYSFVKKVEQTLELQTADEETILTEGEAEVEVLE